MISEKTRTIMVKNLQDSLRMIRHIMDFSLEDFAIATGMTPQMVNDLETKEIEMTATQYIAVAALTDIYLENHKDILPRIKDAIDNDGKNYDEEYDTSFLEDSLLKRWFEDFTVDYDAENFSDSDDVSLYNNEILFDVIEDYKIFLDADILKMHCAKEFVKDLTAALEESEKRIIIPLRSIERLKSNEDSAEVTQALTFIRQMQDADLVQIRGEDSDPDFHTTILNVFERFRQTRNLCLITPDEEFAYEVLKLNDLSESNFEIAAGYIENGIFYFYNNEISNYEMDDDKDIGKYSVENGKMNDVEEDNSNGSGWNEV